MSNDDGRELRRADTPVHRNGSRQPPTPSLPNRRKYSHPSWPGQEPRTPGAVRRNWRHFLYMESLSVLVWALTVPLFRIALVCVQQFSLNATIVQIGTVDVGDILGPLCRWSVLYLLPAKKGFDQAAGFAYGQIWWCLWIARTFGSFPSLTCRIAEWKLGRRSKGEVFVAIFLHVALSAIVWYALSTASLLRQGFGPLTYSDTDLVSVWFYEVLVNALFAVGVHVVPVLLELNQLPTWWTGICLYPLYSVSVDDAGRGSCLSPTVLLVHGLHYGSSVVRVAPQLLGGWLGGMVLQRYFPDEPATCVLRESNENSNTAN